MGGLAECPGCGKLITLGAPKRIWILVCPHCTAMLEVTRAEPPLVSFVYPELVNRPRAHRTGLYLSEPTPEHPAGAPADGTLNPPPGSA